MYRKHVLLMYLYTIYIFLTSLFFLAILPKARIKKILSGQLPQMQFWYGIESMIDNIVYTTMLENHRIVPNE